MKLFPKKHFSKRIFDQRTLLLLIIHFNIVYYEMKDSLGKTGLGREIRYSYSGKQLFHI